MRAPTRCINSAVFFLDDFPSPVPEGDGQYIRQQYGLSIAEFYAKSGGRILSGWRNGTASGTPAP